jgi:hypothetical protein
MHSKIVVSISKRHREMCGQCHAPAILPRYPYYRRPSRPRSLSGWVKNILPSPVFEPRTVQVVATCYIADTIPADLFDCRVTNLPSLNNVISTSDCKISEQRNGNDVTVSGTGLITSDTSPTIFSWRILGKPHRKSVLNEIRSTCHPNTSHISPIQSVCFPYKCFMNLNDT